MAVEPRYFPSSLSEDVNVVPADDDQVLSYHDMMH